jgi:P4 family phage/plasmid primase-like protien
MMTEEANNVNGIMLAAALQYAQRSMPVFPCKQDKSPATPNGFYGAATDEAQIRRWWSQQPDSLLGLSTGEASGLFVLDVDNGEEGRASLAKLETEHGPLPETYAVSTPGNRSKGKAPGEQLYFRYPEGVEKVKSTVSVLGANLDVRGDGGYVIAPPSRGYGVVHGGLDGVAEAPRWLVELVRDDRPVQTQDLGEDIPEGRRNASLTILAGGMRLRGASTTAILAALNEENQVKCKPPLPWHEVVAIARSVGRYAPESLARTDTGNAERLVGRHGHDLKHVYGLGWFVWTGTHWQRDETGAVERRAKDTVRSIHEEAARVADDDERKELAKWAIASESATRIRAMISLARSEPGIPLRVEDLDGDPWLLNCENGTVDLSTGELREHRRENLITKVAPVEYDPDAGAPTWEAFLERALPDESVREFVQRAVGYSLTGVVKEKVLPFLYGPKDTGKTTFVESIMNVLGDGYAQPAAPDLLLAKGGSNHPTEVADLLGKRFVATVEVQQGRKLAESLVKQLTGGDRIKARFMREDFFTFRPTHKIWFAANHRPMVRGTDDAIWGRIKLVPFEVQIPEDEQDKGLPEKLQAEASGILAWAVRGCLEWQRQGSLGEPEEVRAATREYQEEMDPLADFFDERCRLDPDSWISKRDLQRSYKEWCEATNQKHLE